MIKIVLAEDHHIVRNGIRNLLQKNPDFTVVGEVSSGTEVLGLLGKGIIPDIVLADMNMPEMDGIELATHLKSFPGRIKTILLTMNDHERHVVRAFQAGATGYLFKNIGADELIFAINHVYANKQYICLELALRLLERSMNGTVAGSNQQRFNFDLSKRELEILNLIAEGYTNQEIADQLFTSRRTVEGHRQALIDKTGVRNTPALVKFALLNGIIN